MAEQPKVVSRSVALILGAICAVLAVGMIVALIAYLPASSQIDSLNAQVAQKNQSISALNAQIAILNSQISNQNGQNSTSSAQSLQIEINDLETQLNSLENVLYLNASATLFSNQAFTMDPHSNTTLWDQTNTPILYTGFVTVQVTSTSSTTFIELSYAAYGVIYDNAVKVGTAGTASFPVLPGPATISLGNTEANSTVTGTVSATYTY